MKNGILTLVLAASLCFAAALCGETIALNVGAGARESDWRDALASKLNGETEVRVRYGKVDILTESHAIEVDWLAKYDEGLGQALRYGVETGKKPVVALIIGNPTKRKAKKLEYIKGLWAETCATVELWPLTSVEESAP